MRSPPTTTRRLSLASVLVVAAAACKGASVPSDATGPAAEAAASTAPASAAPPPLEAGAMPPLGGVPWMTTLELVGGGYAHVAVPLGATSPRPVVVGVHGAGDHADWACSEWRATTGGGAFVVCPRGTNDVRWKGSLVWSSPAQIARESARAVASLRARFGAYVAEGPALYGAWSQGATLAGEAVAAANRGDADAGTGALFDRVVLVEGGYGGVDARVMARSFVRAGVARVVVCCASVTCRKLATDLEAAGRGVGLPVHVADVGLRGHWFDAPVFAAIAAELPWLVEGDARWRSVLP